MVSYSIIKKSELEGTHRLDAEYYQPEYLRIQKLLSGRSVSMLKDVSVITTGPAYSSEEISTDSGIPLARIGDVVNKIEVDNWLKISRKEFDKFHDRKIKNLDILLSMTGDPPDVGKCNLIEIRENENLAFNQRVAKLTSKISPYYLFAYLSTDLARLQPERNALGIRQRNLGINDLRNTLVFLPQSQIQQDDVGNLVKDYLSKLEHSKALYSQAENLLLEELGLKDFEAEQSLYSVVNFSKLKETNRMDAEYFQPKYEKLITKLKTQKTKELKDALENVPAKFNPSAQPEKLFNYVELSNINASIGVIDGSSEVLGKEAPSRARRVLKAGDVIVSSVEGSLEKVALVGKEREGYLASTGFFQFRSEELLPEVVLVLAKSFVFNNQLEQRCAGTILTAVPRERIKGILIPILPKATQQKIAGLVRESHAARKKAESLLAEAKQKVEDLIERQDK